MEENIDSSFNEAVAKTIKTYREMRNMSLEDVVKKMNNPVSRQSLFKYENNLARLKTSTFLDICQALNLEPQTAYKRINEFAYRIDEEKKELPTEKKETDELDILYSKSKDFLNETEIDMIKHSMQRAIDRYEEQKNKGN